MISDVAATLHEVSISAWQTGIPPATSCSSRSADAYLVVASFSFSIRSWFAQTPTHGELRWRWGSPRNPGIPPWNLSGNTGFPGLEAPGMGLVMLPLALGVCLLFAGVYQKWGRLLVWASLAILFAGVLNTLRISFMPATLWQLTACVFMIASGGGLMFRGLSSYTSLDAGINKRDAPGRSQDRPSSKDDTEAIRRELAKLKRRLDNRESS